MKIFAVSDIHSFFSIFKKELDKKGFEENNPNHLLVVCGDLFDRGPETVELIDYINNLTNVVLVKGNHETLIEKMCDRGYAQTHDISNGTVRTANDIIDFYGNPGDSFNPLLTVRNHLQPIFDRMVDYFETKNYIFVHGWIPMKYDTNKPFAEYGDPTLFDENWREGDWEQARWPNGMKMAKHGIIVPGKTIVCGHWHCSWGWHIDSLKTDNWISQFEESARWDPYVAEGIIAIDRCTAHTKECNVIVLEDELLDESICTNT